MTKLNEEQVAVYLGKLPDWTYESEALRKTFQLPDFRNAIRFVHQIADIVEKDNHHPDLLIRFNKVTVTLTTHDVHGVTGKDFLVAQQIESIK